MTSMKIPLPAEWMIEEIGNTVRGNADIDRLCQGIFLGEKPKIGLNDLFVYFFEVDAFPFEGEDESGQPTAVIKLRDEAEIIRFLSMI